MGPSGKDGTDDWRQPEKPKLGESPASDEDSGACASSWIDGGVGHRNADQMYERQRKTDGDTGKPHRRAPVGGTQDNNEKHIGHHNLADKRGKKRIATRRMGFIAVGSKPALNYIKSRFAGGDEIDHKRAGDCTEDLRYDVRK